MTAGAPTPLRAFRPPATAADADRAALVRRGLRLNWLTIGYNVVEAVVSVAAGLAAGSVALTGFGVDSVIEVTASAAARWRLHADGELARRERVERLTSRVIGASFAALAAWVAYESIESLVMHEAARRSPIGVAILVASLIVMPVLARAKRRVARAMGSAALEADATQTSLCAWLSAIALAGVGLDALLGWWWADPLAALAMVPIIAREGIEGLRGRAACSECGC